MKRLWLARALLTISLPLMLPAIMPSQKPSDPSATLRAALSHNYLVLRDYSDDAAIAYRYNSDETLQPEVPSSRMFALVKIDNVKVSDHLVRLEGKRFFAALDSSSHRAVLTNSVADISIKVDFAPADREALLRNLEHLLFFGSLQEAIASVPRTFAADVPATLDVATNKYEPCNPCNKGRNDNVADMPKATDAGMTAPKLIKQVDPVIPGDLAPLTSAETLIAMIVETNGVGKDFWVVHSAGARVDAAALEAVRQYRFRSALKDGSPVAVLLHVAVHMEKR